MKFIDCGPSDAERIAAFLHPIWMEVYTPIACGGAHTAEREFTEWSSPEAIRKAMGEGHVYGLVDIDGEVKGTYAYHVIDGVTLYINKMYLSIDARGRGNGQEVLRRLFDIGRSLGCREVELNVYSVNERAIRAYERAGMTRKRTVTAWSEGPYEETDYIMWKKL